MSATSPPRRGPIPPNERTARTIGIFNVLFASVLIVWGLCSSLSIMLMPLYTQGMNSLSKKADDDTEARKKTELDALAEAEKKATTDEQKEAITAQRAEIEARPKMFIPVMDFTQLGIDTFRFRAWTISETITGLILNACLLVSGIGLLGPKRWSRTLAVRTAWLKIGRLVLWWSFWCFAIVPTMAQGVAKMVGGIFTQQQAAAGRGGPMMSYEFLVKMYSITYTAMGIGMIVLGSIYPALVIWFLTRPNVKAVFAKPVVAEKPPTEPNETW